MKNMQLSESEKLSNIEQYGEPVPWELVEDCNVFTVNIETAAGYELMLTKVGTYEHTHTGERREFLGGNKQSKFIFENDWPEDNIVTHRGESYVPYIHV